ncbi:MAG: hypothetical protein JSS30_02610 [Verrucomicrobia bacterium]|nr:hypothetical protein [Verrucomicrobiota bacterium]
MKKKQIATGLLVSLLAITPTIIHADECCLPNCCPPTDCCMPDYRPGEPLCDGCALYPAFAGVQLDCAWDLFAYGDFLYWTPIRTSTLVVVTNDNNPPTNPTRREFPQNFGYRPGFRVGVGTVMHCFDDLTLSVDYTRFNHDFRKTFSATAPVTLAADIGALTTSQYRSITTKTGFGLDVVNVLMARPNYIGQNVILRPTFGLQWYKYDSKFSQNCVRAVGGVVDTQFSNYSFSGIGPTGAMNGDWLICWGLRVIGKAQLGVLFAYTNDLDQVVTIPTNNISNQRLKASMNHVFFNGTAAIGLGWGSYFCCNRYHADLSIMYNTLGHVTLLANPQIAGFTRGNTVSFHGLAVSAQLDF